MARIPRPWYWKERDVWCVTIGGKRRILARGKAHKAEATAEFHRLMVALGRQGPSAAHAITVAELFNRFLAHLDLQVTRGEREAVTYEGYGRHLSSAADRFGALRCSDLRPHHVQAWADDPAHERRVPRAGGGFDVRTGPWSATTRNNAIGAVKRAFAWGEEQGLLDSNPIARMRKPTPRRRETIPSPQDVARLLAATRGPLRDLLDALRLTGCRPGEVFALTAAGVSLQAGTWTVRNKTRQKTGRATRVVHLSDATVELSRRLCKRHPEGPIFRNSRGGAWTRNAVGLRLARLREKLGLGPEVVSYALRHLFATDLRQAGVSDATIAVLMGHTDTQMVSKIYGAHLEDRAEHLKEALKKLETPEGGTDTVK